MTPHREKILMTYKFLIGMHEELLTRIINVGMTAEWAEINEIFEPGDSYKFDPEQFRGTGDVNLNKLISFFDELETLMNSLANINSIAVEELDELEEDGG